MLFAPDFLPKVKPAYNASRKDYELIKRMKLYLAQSTHVRSKQRVIYRCGLISPSEKKVWTDATRQKMSFWGEPL